MAGVSLVGGIPDTDVINGFTLHVDVDGQHYEAGNQRGDNGQYSYTVALISHAV